MTKTIIKAKVIIETEEYNSPIAEESRINIWKIKEMIDNGRLEIKEIVLDELTDDYEQILVLGEK